MKICQYCDTENEEDVTTCVACGGNEFYHKCDNCGHVFQEGNYCPNCGVKVGDHPKICYHCGTEYYSNACPNCGYIPKQETPKADVYEWTSSPIQNTTVEQPKKRRTWLWVLGWIFMFPVPLSVLIWRSQKMPTWGKVILLILLWSWVLK